MNDKRRYPMITCNNRLSALALGFAFVVSAWPSFGQDSNSAQRTPSFAQGSNSAQTIQDPKRLAAVQECMIKAGKLPTYGDTLGQTELYKSCMVQRGYRP